MTVLSSIANGSPGGDVRETLNDALLVAQSLRSLGLILPNVAALAAATIPGDVTYITLMGYYTSGDCKPFRIRRVTAPETAVLALDSLFLSNSGATKWVVAESLLLPEYFGAVGNATGVSASGPSAAQAGADDAPAWRKMYALSNLLKLRMDTVEGKKYRMGSHTQHPGGQKTILLLGSDSLLTIRSEIIHDSYDATVGSPLFIFCAGTKSVRTKRVHIRFEGNGKLVFPTDAVRPRRADDTNGNAVYARKGSICIFYTDYFSIIRSSTSGASPTGFQTTCYNSSFGLVDGGYIGLPDAPNDAGDDGFHIIGSCTDIIARGLLINSGDDSISITCENNMDGEKIERITISDCVCTTWQAKTIKIHITGVDQVSTGADKTKNCIIQDVNIFNILGRVRGTEVGANIVVLNENRAAGNIIRRIKIDSVNLDMGTFPKVRPNDGTENGFSVNVARSDEVEITNSTLKGASTGNILYYSCVGGRVKDCLVYSDPAAIPTMMTGLTVTSSVLQSNNRRRLGLSGSPDLSSIVTALATQNTASMIGDNRFPIANITGMASAFQNGYFVVRAADDTNKWIEIENFRSGAPDVASGATGSATITLGLAPSVAFIDCTGTVAKDVKVVAPLGWTVGFIGGRQTQSDRCEMQLTIVDAIYGSGITVSHATQSRISAVAKNCKAGGHLLRILQTSITNPLNHILDSDDMAGLAEVTVGAVGMGYARTALTDYTTDRVDTVRGRQSSVLSGTVTQASAATTFSIPNISIGNYAGYITNVITPQHLVKLIPSANGPTITGIVWNTSTASFDVTTTAAAGAVTWYYTVKSPN